MVFNELFLLEPQLNGVNRGVAESAFFPTEFFYCFLAELIFQIVWKDYAYFSHAVFPECYCAEMLKYLSIQDNKRIGE